MRRAVRRAVQAAAADGVELRVASGWRSRAHQERLFADAVAKYGSPQAARRWVLPPDDSEHVQGRAVDVAPPEAAAWLDEHGVRFGLCRRYDNEPWHFERLAPAVGSALPAEGAARVSPDLLVRARRLAALRARALVLARRGEARPAPPQPGGAVPRG